MKQLLFLLLFPCFALAQYQGNANQKITLGEQTTADGLVWRGRLADTANLLTNKLDTSVYIVLDTGTRAMWYYRVSTTPKWTRLVDSLNNLQGQLSLTSKVTGVLPVANGGTGATTLSPNNYLIRTNSSGVFDTSLVYEAGGNVGINTNNPLANLVLFNPTGTSTRFVAGNTNTPTALYSTYLSQGWSIFELYKDGLGSTGTTAFVGGINDASPTSGSATMTFMGYNKAVGTPGINDLRTHIIIGGLEAVNSGNFQFYTMNSGNISEKLRISASGNVGIGTTSPTARLHLAAGTASASSAPLKFTSGTNLTTAEAGVMEFNGTNLFFSPSTTRHTVNHGLTGSATLDFPSTTTLLSADLTITITGAADGDVVSLGVPNAAVNANTCYTAWVSAANTVTVRFNNYSSLTVNPVSGTFKVFVTK